MRTCVTSTFSLDRISEALIIRKKLLSKLLTPASVGAILPTVR